MAEENKPSTEEQEAINAMMGEMSEDSEEGDSAIDQDASEGALSQDEIDSLLGFGETEETPKKGLEAILYRSRDNYEKFPMLEVIFDRFSRSVSSAMRSFTGEISEINVENITSIRFEDYMNSIPLPSMLSVFQAVEWENLGVMTIDSSLVYSMIDILLGGGKGDKNFRIEGRPFTVIEQDLIKSFSRVIFEEMSNAFTPVTTVSFKIGRAHV